MNPVLVNIPLWIKKVLQQVYFDNGILTNLAGCYLVNYLVSN